MYIVILQGGQQKEWPWPNVGLPLKMFTFPFIYLMLQRFTAKEEWWLILPSLGNRQQIFRFEGTEEPEITSKW